MTVILAVTAATGSGAAAAPGRGLDDPIHRWTGDQPGERFGWAVADLADIDGDGVRDAIISAPRHVNADGVVAGHTDVRSGRTGDLIHRFDGVAEDRHGFAIADAGDVDGDGTHDIVAGAPGSQALACVDIPRAGRVYVYSGDSGDLLHTIEGEVLGDQFGAAVGSAGDVRSRRPRRRSGRGSVSRRCRGRRRAGVCRVRRRRDDAAHPRRVGCGRLVRLGHGRARRSRSRPEGRLCRRGQGRRPGRPGRGLCVLRSQRAG